MLFFQRSVISVTLLLLAVTVVHAQSIETELVQLKEVSTTYMLEGLVEAELKTTISAQTSGIVKKIHFDVDDFVAKDKVVVEIDDKQQRASLRQAEAAEKEARARLQEAQSEFNRVSEVYKKNVVSKSVYDAASAALKTARARLESSQAATSKAQEQLDYTKVRAPYSGILTSRMVEPGETVNVGRQLVSGVSLEKLRVLTHVPQSIIKEVRDRHYAIVVTEDSEIVSTDMTFFPFADPLTHSFALRVRLPLTGNELFPGMHVKIALEVGRENKTVIPFNAVAFRGEVTGVYVLQDGKLHFRHVRLGRRLEDNEVVVVAGVSPGDKVVHDPVAAAIAIKSEKAE
jgi:membrane fusion protein, multidrug efflux system